MLEHSPKDILNHLSGHKGFDYTQITDEIYIGTNMCCQYGFSQELLLKGIRADVSLEEDRTDAPNGVDYFLWLPTVNETSPTQQDFEIGVKFLDFAISNKIKTFIHCKNGHSRAPTLFTAYLVSKGQSIDEAIRFIVSKRPSVHINELQMQGIKEFTAAILKKI
jgi:protein-tyrosine phosphatase